MNRVMMYGSSVVMQVLCETYRKAANSHCPILIRGESGTGKELLAREIHDKSPRSNGPFVPINCGALTESLLESELFGHEKGSFTGANTRHLGVFEQAKGGTIFLDEIGEMSPAAQAKLLRVLEDKEVRRVGGIEGTEIDARVISATNANLERLVTEKTFREDLYYRINTIELCLPALRERMEDIQMFIDYFREMANKENGRHVERISEEALTLLKRYPWPGNIRELRNTVERMVVLGTSKEIGVLDIPTRIKESPALLLSRPSTTVLMPLDIAVTQLTNSYIALALEQTGNNRTLAAKLLGIDRTTLYREIRKNPELFRTFKSE